jgi:hypothetical protein
VIAIRLGLRHEANIASQRVGARRRPMTGLREAIQSVGNAIIGLLRRFAPRNDEKRVPCRKEQISEESD